MPPDTFYEFGDYRLDPARRLLSHRTAGQVAVTSRVFDTLLHLVQNAGRLVDKRELMSAVWGDAVVEENNLTQAISTLRQVLGERPGEHRYIATTTGRGYRFIAPVTTTSSGRAPDSPVAPAAQPPTSASRIRARWLFGASVGIAVLVAAAVLFPRATPSPPSPITTIAVLPFRPLVASESDPAIELGMTDTLIARLSGTGRFVVRPLSSVRRYAALEQDPLQAGRELNVEAVLEGSISRDGSAVRVTTRLVRVSDGAAVWVDTIDRPWTGLFSVQDSIGERVGAALAQELSGEQRAGLRRRDTQNEEAYRLYLLGRYHLGKLVPEEIDRAIGYFRQATAQDTQYALAYAGLAEAHRALAITSDRRPGEVLPLGKAAALKALELDGSLDSAHASLCFIQIWWDWDWAGAEESCRRALDLDPNSADGHRAYAILLSDLGKHEEAIAHARRASGLDPLSLITTSIEGHVLHYAGRDDEALLRLRATLQLEQTFWIAHLFVGKVHLGRGRLQEALAEFELAKKFSAGNSEAISLIGYTLAKRGDLQGALRTLAELQARAADRYVPPFNVAMIYNGLGNEDETFAWLKKAYDDRDVRLTFLKIEPKWNALRTDERFAALASSMQL